MDNTPEVKTLQKTRETKFKKAFRALCVIFAALILFTFIAWGVVSDWGQLRFVRMQYVGPEGTVISMTAIAPKGIGRDNQVPAAIFNHGGGSQGYQEFPFAIEYARRGFVAIMSDDINCGETDYNSAGLPERTLIIQSLIDYAIAQTWCDGRVVLSGPSSGTDRIALTLNTEYIDKVACAVMVVGNTGVERLPEYPCGVPIIYINAEADWLSEVYKGTDLPTEQWAVNRVRNYTGVTAFEFSGIIGSFEDKTAFGAYRVNSTHENAYTNKVAQEAIHSFVQNAVPTGTTVAVSDIKFPTINFFYFIVIILFIFAIGQFSYVLTLSPMFYGNIHTKLPEAQRLNTSKRLLQFVMDFIPPFILFFLLTRWLNGTFSRFVRPVFRSGFVNGVVFWLVCCCIFLLTVFIFKNRRLKKTRSLTAADYGFGSADEVKLISWKRVGSGAAVACITTLMAFVWLDAVTKITGLGYVVTPWASFVRLTPQRFVYSLPYLVLLVFVVIVTCIAGTATSRRFKDTGNETWDTIRDVGYNVILSAMPVLLIMLSFYGVCLLRHVGEPLFPLSWYGGMTICATMPMPTLVAMGIGCSSYLYRKTGNIWTGAFLGGMLMTFFTIGYAVIG